MSARHESLPQHSVLELVLEVGLAGSRTRIGALLMGLIGGELGPQTTTTGRGSSSRVTGGAFMWVCWELCCGDLHTVEICRHRIRVGILTQACGDIPSYWNCQARDDSQQDICNDDGLSRGHRTTCLVVSQINVRRTWNCVLRDFSQS